MVIDRGSQTPTQALTRTSRHRHAHRFKQKNVTSKNHVCDDVTTLLFIKFREIPTSQKIVLNLTFTAIVRVADLDLDLFGRIRIRLFINTVCWNQCCGTGTVSFWPKKNRNRILALGSGSGSGSYSDGTLADTCMKLAREETKIKVTGRSFYRTVDKKFGNRNRNLGKMARFRNTGWNKWFNIEVGAWVQ
jgi:hypothetical protein